MLVSITSPYKQRTKNPTEYSVECGVGGEQYSVQWHRQMSSENHCINVGAYSQYDLI